MSYLARSFFPGFQLLNNTYAACFPPNLHLSQTLPFPDGIVWNGGSKSFHNVHPQALNLPYVKRCPLFSFRKFPCEFKFIRGFDISLARRAGNYEGRMEYLTGSEAENDYRSICSEGRCNRSPKQLRSIISHQHSAEGKQDKYVVSKVLRNAIHQALAATDRYVDSCTGETPGKERHAAEFWVRLCPPVPSSDLDNEVQRTEWPLASKLAAE